MQGENLFWDETRRLYDAERNRRGWTLAELARRSGAQLSAVSRFLSPTHRFTRIPPVIDQLDTAFDWPSGYGRRLLTDGMDTAGPGHERDERRRSELDDLEAEIRSANISEAKRNELLARIQRMRANLAMQSAEIYQAVADAESA